MFDSPGGNSRFSRFVFGFHDGSAAFQCKICRTGFVANFKAMRERSVSGRPSG